MSINLRVSEYGFQLLRYRLYASSIGSDVSDIGCKPQLSLRAKASRALGRPERKSLLIPEVACHGDRKQKTRTRVTSQNTQTTRQALLHSTCPSNNSDAGQGCRVIVSRPNFALSTAVFRNSSPHTFRILKKMITPLFSFHAE